MRLKLLVLGFFLIMSSFVYSGVNYMNGNYFVTYVDILVPGGGEELQIKRTYNSWSSSGYVGWYGNGWGNQFETYLEAAADGSVIVYEHGSGGETRFIPKGATNPKVAAEKIVSEMKKKSSLSEKVTNEMVEKLKNNAELRRSYERSFAIKSEVAVGTTLYSNQRGIQQIHRLKEGYKRVYNEGRVEYFNNDGKLIKIDEKSGYSITLDYQGKELKMIKDSAAKQIFFSWYPSGRVKELWTKETAKALFVYDQKNNLIKSTDVAKNVYEFKYDENNKITEILYQDKTKVALTYTKNDQRIYSVKDRNGNLTTYNFERSKNQPDLHYWVNVVEKTASGRESKSRYEYQHTRRADGELFTKKILTEVGGRKDETIYNEQCLLPEQITDGAVTTKFTYNEKCLLVEKNSTSGEVVKLTYHPTYNKIIRVDGKIGKSSYWIKFEYDEKANLSKAENDQGKAILLVYDVKGQITKMVDGNIDSKSGKRSVSKTLSFKYNAMGKPVEITLDKVGKITVEYDNLGDIKNVDSSSNQQVAYQVTDTFNNLLDIVRLAGVDLSL